MTGFCQPPVEYQFQAGNPGGPGRPLGSKNFSTILKERLDRPTNIMEDGRYLTRLEALAEQSIALAFTSEKEEVKLKATGEIVDRIDGKAKAITENTNTDVQLTQDEWAKMINARTTIPPEPVAAEG